MSSIETICSTFNLALLVQNLGDYLSLILLVIQVGLIVFRIVLNVIKVAKSKKSISKEESENLFAEDINDIKTIIDTIKLKGE